VAAVVNANAKFKLIAWGTALSLLIIAIAVLVAMSQSRAAGRQMAIHALATARAVQVQIAAERLKNLEHLSATIAANPNLLSSVAQALEPRSPVDPPADVTPLHDLLEQLRRVANLKAAAILDAEGGKVTTTGDIAFATIDFRSVPMVAQARKNSADAIGTFEGDNRVHFVAINPLRNGAAIVAFLLSADQFDDASVRSAAQAGQTDLALLALRANESRVLFSTLEGRDARDLPALAARRKDDWRSRAAAPAPEPFDVEIGGRTWTALAAKLRPSSANTILLSLKPLTTSDAVLEAIAWPLLAGVLAGMIILAAILFVLWQRIIGPMATMVDLSDRARHGDYALAIKTGSSGLAGRLALAFNHLLNELDRHRPPHGAPRRRATDRK
jgi:HAMP domain-containing protein